jgi:hypothetical protein
MQRLISKLQGELSRPLLLPALNTQHFSVVTKAINIVFELTRSYRMPPEITINSLDLFYRFMESDSLNCDTKSDCAVHPEIYAIACFLISVKFREIHFPTLQDLSKVTHFKCKEKDIQSAEENLLVSVQWELNTMTGNRFPILIKSKSALINILQPSTLFKGCFKKVASALALR